MRDLLVYSAVVMHDAGLDWTFVTTLTQFLSYSPRSQILSSKKDDYLASYIRELPFEKVKRRSQSTGLSRKVTKKVH
jgi:hypothetical protein